jgi:hypothetical protein
LLEAPIRVRFGVEQAERAADRLINRSQRPAGTEAQALNDCHQRMLREAWHAREFKDEHEFVALQDLSTEC